MQTVAILSKSGSYSRAIPDPAGASPKAYLGIGLKRRATHDPF